MEIKNLLQKIITTCKTHIDSGNWSKNEAIRYAYITLGKEISKSAKFFFSLEGKYGEHGLSVEEMKQIHYAINGYEVTCYVTARMLKSIFSEIGIESQIIQSEFSRPYISDGQTLDIFHSYLICVGDDDKKYFLSLNSDLVNIKLNAATEHFATDVPYEFNDRQTYQGEKIDHSVIEPAELLEIDKKIGYTLPVYNPSTGNVVHIYANINDTKHDVFGKQKEPYDYFLMSLSSLDQNFLNNYERLFDSFKRADGSSKTNFSELDLDEIRQLEWHIFNECLKLIKQYLNITTDEQNRFFDLFNREDLNLDELKIEVKKYIQENLNKENSATLSNIQTNPYRISSIAISFIDIIETFTTPEKIQFMSETDRYKLRLQYEEIKQKTSKLFISQETIDMYCGKRTPSNEFLVTKLLTCIEHDFECATSKVCAYRPIISTKMKSVEQARFLKEYLRTILKLEFPTDADFQKRIMFSSLAEINNPNKNAFIIHVKNEDDNSDEPSYSMIYNPETNTIALTNVLALRQRYKILSKTVNSKIYPSSGSGAQSQEK